MDVYKTGSDKITFRFDAGCPTRYNFSNLPKFMATLHSRATISSLHPVLP